MWGDGEGGVYVSLQCVRCNNLYTKTIRKLKLDLVHSSSSVWLFFNAIWWLKLGMWWWDRDLSQFISLQVKSCLWIVAYGCFGSQSPSTITLLGWMFTIMLIYNSHYCKVNLNVWETSPLHHPQKVHMHGSEFRTGVWLLSIKGCTSLSDLFCTYGYKGDPRRFQ